MYENLPSIFSSSGITFNSSYVEDVCREEFEHHHFFFHQMQEKKEAFYDRYQTCFWKASSRTQPQMISHDIKRRINLMYVRVE